MEIIFLASSMASRGEHSYRLLEEVGSALQARKIPFRIFAAKSVEPDLAENMELTPHFTHSFYACSWTHSHLGPLFTKSSFRWLHRIPGSIRTLEFLARKLQGFAPTRSSAAPAKYTPLEYQDWATLNESYAADLAALPEAVWTPQNLIVITATCQNQLGGLVQFLAAQNQDRLPKVICHLMFPPDWSPSGRSTQLGRKFYTAAFRQAKPLIGKKLFFTAENVAMTDLYRRDFGIESKILPVPLHIGDIVAREKQATPRFGFFGYSKSDKGFHLLPEAIALCSARNLTVEFHVQIQHSHWEQATMKAEKLLRGLPNVQLIEGTLSSQDYLEEIGKADVMLLPYDPKLFGMRGSGIFTEAVTSGRPIVAADGTFAAESIKKGEAQGEIFAPYDANAFADAITRLLPRLALHRKRAVEQAKVFARHHSGEAYAEVLMSFSQAEAQERAENQKLTIVSPGPDPTPTPALF